MNVVSVPSGINRPPGRVDIASAWQGAEMKAKANPDRWLILLAAGEIAELENAAETYLGRSKEIAEITKESFPLPHFGAHLEDLKKKLLVGLGFEVIRGLPVAKYSQEFAATIFCGVGAHLGSARSQNAAGHILGHVRDIGADAKDPNISNLSNFGTSDIPYGFVRRGRIVMHSRGDGGRGFSPCQHDDNLQRDV
ncbi:hypothetical protein ACVWWP_006869 [Bradyrhizobium sp. LM3.6]